MPSKRGDENFWTIELYISELENLLRFLDVREYDLFGHSWGAILAAKVAVAASHHPKSTTTTKPTSSTSQRRPRLHKLILASGLCSTSEWIRSIRGLVATMPQEVQDAIAKAEKTGDFESDAYKKAIDSFAHRYICRLEPWPKALTQALGELECDNTVYETMWGPSEVTINGSLRGVFLPINECYFNAILFSFAIRCPLISLLDFDACL